MDTKLAARSVLEAHDLLRVADAAEPPIDDDGMPLDHAVWQDWYDMKRRPAYEHWSSAMDDLAEALGEPDLSRHPFNFRARCEAILAESVAKREP